MLKYIKVYLNGSLYIHKRLIFVTIINKNSL